MISQRIDLTENHDFSGFENVFDGPLDAFDTLVGVYYENDDEMVSPDVYNIRKRRESIFGKRKHRNERRKLFGDLFDYEPENECCRCGKQLAPWRNINKYLCRDCENSMEKTYKELPWRKSKIVRLDDRGQGDLFYLK